jgi:transcriptional regulator of acetoin/glycerol metabolism
MLVEHTGGGRFFVRVEANRSALALAIAGVAGRSPTATPAAANDALASLDNGDERLAAAIERARKVLGTSIPILLQGEAGVGKEVFARALHASGPHREGPFLAVQCAALGPDSDAAFVATAGTLFLDEIGDLPPDLQRRLLLRLEARHGTDFTLVCASRRPLRAEVDNGRFSADLYYRINGLVLNLPALRERQDLAALTAALLEQAAPGRGLALTPDLASAFANHAWPGNLRQLANALQLACALLEPGAIRIDWHHLADDLAAELRHPVPRSASDEPAESLRHLSDQAIERAVALAHGNMSEAARRLGISRNTLYRRLRRPNAEE